MCSQTLRPSCAGMDPPLDILGGGRYLRFGLHTRGWTHQSALLFQGLNICPSSFAAGMDRVDQNQFWPFPRVSPARAGIDPMRTARPFLVLLLPPHSLGDGPVTKWYQTELNPFQPHAQGCNLRWTSPRASLWRFPRTRGDGPF